MNRLARTAARILALTMISTLFLTATAFAAEGDPLVVGIGKTTGSSLRLRSAPSLDAGVITMLNKDWTIAVLGEADGWYHVAHNGDDGYVSSEFFTMSEETEFEYYGRINARGVNVRAESNIDSEIVNNLGLGSGVTVTGIENGWYHITGTYGEGWVRSDYISLTNETPLTPGASVGDSSIVDFARQFLGTRYSYGGAAPGGFDCSGFTMYVYKQFGVSLPHTATGQWQSGLGTRVYSLGELQPGDLVFFNDPARNAGKACSHAGIYIGGGQMIHSSSSRSGGVIYSDLTDGYYNTYFVGGIHI
ncbi:MAG: C40 family peptidase [Oscillibacter sp.]|nr:SH3 domain-containing C40 family peptidase [uncultured Oscillibacter sp.]MCI8971320.1 C40 family peptidase [Oscillibacter sp.]